MTNEPQTHAEQVPVLVVGAGPVGLSLALGLARCGVRSMVVERDERTSEHSKAPGIHVRTREAFRQWGVEERVRGAGTLLTRLEMTRAREGRRPLLSLDFSRIADEAERPGVLILEQAETERLLLEAVRETGLCEVRFASEAAGLTQDREGVTVTVAAGRDRRSIRAQFVVGCDGAGSFVRRALELPFEGGTYSVRPMLADVAMQDARDALPWPRIRNRPGGITSALRLRPGVWRIIAIDSDPEASDQVPDREVHRRVADVLGEGPVDVVWRSRFRIHLRSSPRFRRGRVLLAGDAAHVHSPVGGLGMNGGIQDAHNLAWKLALALRGGERERLLDSYEQERRAVVVGTVSRYTDVITRAFMRTPSAVRGAAGVALGLAIRIPALEHRALRRTAMLDLAYPPSELLAREDAGAGVRVPDVLLRAGDGAGTRLHDLIGYDWALIEVGAPGRSPRDLPVDNVIRVGAGGLRDTSGRLRRLLDGRDGWILVRPDAHVTWARSGGRGGVG